jgi:hypothetical protein
MATLARLCNKSIVITLFLIVMGALLFRAFTMEQTRVSELRTHAPPRPHQPARATHLPEGTRPPETQEDIVAYLRSAQPKELGAYIKHLGWRAPELQLTNEQIEDVIGELQGIEQHDPYQEMVWRGKVTHRTPENGRMVYVNRELAHAAIESLGSCKVANDLAALPLEIRVQKILDIVEGCAEVPGDGHRASNWFRRELWRIGKDAVPHILSRAEQVPHYGIMYSQMLSGLKDPRGTAFILETLRALPRDKTMDRCEVIRGLRELRSPEVIEALIEAVHDDVRERGGARPRQQPRAGDLPHPVLLYPVRKCAAETLASMTGQYWGLLFNEEPKAWRLWHELSQPVNFDPMIAEWSDEEVAELMENFTYNAMLELMRSPGWESSGNGRPLSRLGEDIRRIRQLGPRAAQSLVTASQSIAAEFPIWQHDLQTWCELILGELGASETQAANSFRTIQ